MTANQIAFYPQSSAGGGMTLIQSQTVASSVASVTFSGIPQNYTSLRLVWSCNSTGNAGTTSQVTFNGDSGANYVAASTVNNYSTGSGSLTALGSFTANAIIIGGAQGEAYFPFYTSTVLDSSAVGQGVSYESVMVNGGGFHTSVGPITSITIAFTNATTIASGTFNLYGMI